LALFLDSASIEDAQRAQALGFIEGITTNPKLIAQTGRQSLDILADLVEIFDGHVFYQVTADTLEARVDEAWQAYEVRPDRVVIKVPTTTDNFALIAKLPGVDIAMTSIFSPTQAYLAAQAQAHYVIPYVNRATHLLGDGVGLLREVVEVVRGTDTQVLAASIKTIDEAMAAVRAGAQHLTLPMSLIEAMGNHELSFQAIEEFKTG
jgi:transaldolase